ncbi:unnamed protein product [Phytomonas sp. Hart1]|nr:unnamed protein product [Phytomonas sp. Hart1]|eukprot:CCW67124.1 unnamed protein product [Phytomonas sp. isolate Hart1]
MALQRTAQDACSRKVHCVDKKYLDDPFVHFFARDTTIVNSPLMNRGTWLRTTAIERCVKNFSESVNGEPIQIISFGAGVDTLYFRLKSQIDVKISAYVELDFQDLVEEKRAIIKQTPLLSRYIDSQYHLMDCDLRAPDDVIKLLKKCVKADIPTILLGEMVFVYIEASIVTELLRQTLHDVLGAATPVELITYDAMQPNDRFGQMMIENLSRSEIYLKSIADFPTPAHHEKRWREIGFKSVKAMSMRHLYLTVPKDTMGWLSKLEMVDDWDEWNLVHDHYCFVVAHTKENNELKIFS